MSATPVCRLKDKNTGGSTAIQSSKNVFCNGLGVHLQGQKWTGHGRGKHSHPISRKGSPTVFVNGKPLMRVSDPISCGHKVATGSPNTFCGP